MQQARDEPVVQSLLISREQPDAAVFCGFLTTSKSVPYHAAGGLSAGYDEPPPLEEVMAFLATWNQVPKAQLLEVRYQYHLYHSRHLPAALTPA